MSSVNWTPPSFHDNRECAVAIYSSEIADFYAQAFLNDHNQCYDYDGFSVDISEIEETYPAGQEITFTVSVNKEGTYTYIWDIGDGSKPRPTNESRIVCQPEFSGDAQTYVLKVTVTNDKGESVTVTQNYTILAEGAEVPTDPEDPSSGDSTSDDAASFLSDYMYIIAPLIVIILAIIGAASRAGRKGKKRK